MSAGDLTPLSPPQLSGSDFATVSNCPNVSPRSSYSAGWGSGCGSVRPTGMTAPVPYAPPPAIIPAPAVMPPLVVDPLATSPVPASATPADALISFGQETYPVQVGQGLWGQPVAYVPGQGFRNWVRYFFP